MKKIVRIIGIPMDLGQAHRGVDMGPSAIRYAGLAARLGSLGYTIRDSGNLEVMLRYALPEKGGKNLEHAIQKACENIYQAASDVVDRNEFPIFLGGDHSLSIGTIGGITDKRRTGVLWIDAHGDFNTQQTSATGNIHGMSLAVLLGIGDKKFVDIGRSGAKILPEDVVMIGIRDLDREEKKMLRQSGVTVYTMRNIDEHGMSKIMHEALARLSHLPNIHVSLDMDCVDPGIAAGVGTPSPGGLTYREAQLIMEIASDYQRVSSLDLVEVNPVLDHCNQTAELAVELAASLLGKSII